MKNYFHGKVVSFYLLDLYYFGQFKFKQTAVAVLGDLDEGVIHIYLT